MITSKGWNQKLMMSLYKKEASYDAGVPMIAGNACLMSGWLGEPDWPDIVEDNKGEITGSEFGTRQELIAQAFKLPYSEPKAKPNSFAGLAALTLGAVATTKDGTRNAWKHKITPVPVGTALPSIQAEHLKGGIQYAYTGVKSNSLKISGQISEQSAGTVSVEAELIGSGSRTTSATAFVPKIDESWLKLSNCQVFMENGSNISVDATLAQGSENISSGTPVALGPRLKSFEWLWNNNLKGQPGAGGAGKYQDMDYGRRTLSLKVSLLFSDSAEIDHFLNQNPLAIEFDLKGAQVVANSLFYFGFQLIVPKFQLKSAPLPKGGVNDYLTLDMDCNVLDDGTNPVSIIECYNGQSAYLAA